MKESSPMCLEETLDWCFKTKNMVCSVISWKVGLTTRCYKPLVQSDRFEPNRPLKSVYRYKRKDRCVHTGFPKDLDTK